MMRRTNIDAGPILALVGGLLLVVSLFLNWYEPGVSAWTVFEFVDLLLALSALSAVLISIELMVPQLLPIARVPAAERVLLTAGTVALVLVGSQLVNHPPAAQREAVDYGAWLALAGGALLFAGGLAPIAWVSVGVTSAHRQPPAAGPPPPPPPPPAPPPRPPREPG